MATNETPNASRGGLAVGPARHQPPQPTRSLKERDIKLTHRPKTKLMLSLQHLSYITYLTNERKQQKHFYHLWGDGPPSPGLVVLEAWLQESSRTPFGCLGLDLGLDETVLALEINRGQGQEYNSRNEKMKPKETENTIYNY